MAGFCGASSRARRYFASAAAKLKSMILRIAPCAECASARFGSSSSALFAEARAFAIASCLSFARDTPVAGGQIQRRGRQLRIGERVTRVEPDRLLVVADRFAHILGGASIEVEISLQEALYASTFWLEGVAAVANCVVCPLFPSSATLSSFATAPAISDCTAKMSFNSRS